MSKKENIYKDIDITKPIDKKPISVETTDCFGLEWDMRVKECGVCAMNEICGIMFNDTLKKKVKEVESKHEVFLDKADFHALNEDALYEEIKNNDGKISVESFVDRLKLTANIVDDVAIIEWIKRFKAKNNLKFRGGFIWTV